MAQFIAAGFQLTPAFVNLEKFVKVDVGTPVVQCVAYLVGILAYVGPIKHCSRLQYGRPKPYRKVTASETSAR